MQWKFGSVGFEVKQLFTLLGSGDVILDKICNLFKPQLFHLESRNESIIEGVQ